MTQPKIILKVKLYYNDAHSHWKLARDANVIATV